MKELKWIDVNDALPKTECDVLAVISDDTIFMARFNGELWILYFSDAGMVHDYRPKYKPTHWMPLPSPPTTTHKQ